MSSLRDERPDAARRYAVARRTRAVGAIVIAILAGCALALFWVGRADPGADLLGHPYADYAADPDAIRRRLLVAVLVMLVFCGLIGAVAWMIDRSDDRASGRSPRRRG